MLLNHPALVVALACVANALVFAVFNTNNAATKDKRPMVTILKVLAANAVALGCLFIAFGESRPEIYHDPVNF